MKAIRLRTSNHLGDNSVFFRYKTRKVNFVIFVVDGVSIIEATESNKKGYIDILRETFMYPFLSIGGRDC